MAAIRMQEQPYRELLLQKGEIENATAEIERLKALDTHLNGLIENIQRSERAAMQSVSETEKAISELKEQRYQLEADPRLKELDNLLTELRQNLAGHQADLKERWQWIKDLDNDPIVLSLKRDLEGYAQAEALLNKRPDACTIDDCPFIKNALDAIEQKTEKEKLLIKENNRVQGRMEVVEQEIKNLEEEITLTENEISRAIAKRQAAEKDIGESVREIDSQISLKQDSATRLSSKITEAQMEAEGCREEQRQIPPKIQSLEELAGKAADLEQASRRLDEINQAIAEQNTAYSETSASLNETWLNLILKEQNMLGTRKM